MVETIIVQTVSEFQAEVKRTPIVVVDFFAHWHNPCKFFSPILKELAQGYETKYPPVDGVKQFSLFYKDGELVETVVGANNVMVQEVWENLLRAL